MGAWNFESYVRWIVRRRKAVVVGAGVVTVALLAQLRSLTVIIDPDSTLPQTHPYIVAGNFIEKTFGNKFTVVIGLTPAQGDAFQPAILDKLRRITTRIQNAPSAVKTNVISLAARKAKAIEGNEEGMIVRPLMERTPSGPEEMQKLRAAIAANPAYENLLVSRDGRTVQVVAEFKKSAGGFQAIQDAVEAAVAPERDGSVQIDVAGLPSFLALLEKYSARMGFLFPLALLVIGLIHYEAFRTVQALALPLVTALLAVAWAMGFLGLMREPFDVFNSSTPILILAIAAGHAVQILKRYYEEYAALRSSRPNLTPHELNELAVVESLRKVGPVMAVACLVAALGFFSLMVFEIKSIRTFGIFTGAGVVSALILELTFIPALRSMLPPPGDREISREAEVSFWDRLTGFFFELAMHRRRLVYATVAGLVILLSLGGYWLRIDNSQKAYFYGSVPVKISDESLNSKMAGTNPLYVLIRGDSEDAIKRPETLRFMQELQEEIARSPEIGKTISIVDFLKKMNQAMNAGKPEAYALPASQDLVAQYFLLYSSSGEPGDFDSYVDYGYQNAVVAAFSKTDSSAFMDAFAKRIAAFAAAHKPPGIEAQVGGGSMGGAALNEIMIREKILNILQIMGAVFLVSALVFRSALAGLLILMPLLAAVFVNFGIMGLLGIPLQIATALVSAMAVGIGADYGIYMSYRLREELAADPDEERAVRKAFQSAGKAAIFVSTAVAGGFGLLMLSWGFMIHIWMGFLIATAMLVSSISALTIFPSLIFSLRPKFIYGKRRTSMKPSNVAASLAAGTLIVAAAFAPSPARAAEPALSAEKIAERSFVASKVADSVSDATFRLVNADGKERVRETRGQTKLVSGTTDNMRLVTFVSPTDVKGTKTLLIERSGKDDDMWVYLPAMRKSRRLVASNKKDSFVGTDFSYGDVIGHRVEDWTHKILREEKADGRDCWVVESVPKRPEVGENSGYSKRVGWIDKESFVAVKGEAYDLNGELLKRFAARNIEKVDAKLGRWQPMELEAQNAQTNHKTILQFKNYKANQGVSDDLFSARSLERQ